MNIFLTLIKSKSLPWIVLFGVLYFGGIYIKSIITLNQSLLDDKTELISIIDDKNDELLDLKEQRDENSKLIVKQNSDKQSTDRQLRNYQFELERLKHENEQLRIWSDTSLPDDIKRLYSRPEIKGSADYQDWLSRRNTLLYAGKQSIQ